MEENNNNFVIKVLAIILIAILGINVYRTESTKKEISELTSTVDLIQAQLDSLVIQPASAPSSAQSADKKKVATLERRVVSLESQVSSLKGTVETLTKPAPNTKTAVSTANTSTSKGSKITVSAKVKVENRYVMGTTYLPKVSIGPEGVVVINVSMDRVGIVSSVSVNSATTITDEDILDLCKESALKTSFAYNPDAPQKSTGTITYTFMAK